MKKLLIIIVVTSSIISCSTTKVSPTNTASRPASDTALQGDSMKAPIKP